MSSIKDKYFKNDFATDDDLSDNISDTNTDAKQDAIFSNNSRDKEINDTNDSVDNEISMLNDLPIEDNNLIKNNVSTNIKYKQYSNDLGYPVTHIRISKELVQAVSDKFLGSISLSTAVEAYIYATLGMPDDIPIRDEAREKALEYDDGLGVTKLSNKLNLILEHLLYLREKLNNSDLSIMEILLCVNYLICERKDLISDLSAKPSITDFSTESQTNMLYRLKSVARDLKQKENEADARRSYKNMFK